MVGKASMFLGQFTCERKPENRPFSSYSKRKVRDT